jgi:hypothetical protein
LQIVEGSPACSLVKAQVSNFVQNSKTIMTMLDELAKAHPFISCAPAIYRHALECSRCIYLVAVSIFKGALTLELARRDNDQKVLALIAKMCDMMSVFGLYAPVHPPPRAMTAHRIG